MSSLLGVLISNNLGYPIYLSSGDPGTALSIFGWTGQCDQAACDNSSTGYFVPKYTPNNPGEGEGMTSTFPINLKLLDGDILTIYGIGPQNTVNDNAASLPSNKYAISSPLSSPVLNLQIGVNSGYKIINRTNSPLTVAFSNYTQTVPASGAATYYSATPLNDNATITSGSYTNTVTYSAGTTPTVGTGSSSAYECLASYQPQINAYVITFQYAINQSIKWGSTGSILTLTDTNTNSSTNAVVHGFSLTTTEYLLQGLGMQSFAINNISYWPTNKSDVSQPDESILDSIISYLPQVNENVIPAIRIPLNAAYYTGVVTAGWIAKNNQFPPTKTTTSLSTQYVTLIDNIITYFTARGIVSILDLHWNDDNSNWGGDINQAPMALKSYSGYPNDSQGNNTNNTGDSVAFWQKISGAYSSNPYVWYELYNEPYMDPSLNPNDPSDTAKWTNIWLNGGTIVNSTVTPATTTEYYGMLQLLSAIGAVDGMIVIAGGFDYAYDATSLITLNSSLTNSQNNIMYNFHPYYGGPQTPEKNPAGFSNIIESISSVKRPLIITETGQYCCPPNGDCGSASPADSNPTCTNSVSMSGYVNTILSIAEQNNMSWTLWAWNPATLGPYGASCCPILVNYASELNTPISGVAGCELCVATESNPNPSITSCGCCAPPGPCGADYPTLMKNFYGSGPAAGLKTKK